MPYFVLALFFGLAHAQSFRHLHLPPLSQSHFALPHAEQFIFSPPFDSETSGTRSSIADEDAWSQGADPGAAVRYYRGRETVSVGLAAKQDDGRLWALRTCFETKDAYLSITVCAHRRNTSATPTEITA